MMIMQDGKYEEDIQNQNSLYIESQNQSIKSTKITFSILNRNLCTKFYIMKN